jgi:hypothetical protein
MYLQAIRPDPDDDGIQLLDVVEMLCERAGFLRAANMKSLG